MSRFTERIKNFNKTFNIYQEAVKAYDPNKVLTHMALVQTYEICFELAWKCLKDYLKEKGIEASYPTDVIKEAFNKNTITDGQLWIDMLNARNSTSHEYNIEKVGKYLTEISTTYFEEVKKFKNWLGEISG
ncbi:MAG: nucleotidyltransferase [Cyanobacteria bacterium SIG32]|nr:nucleotidyltransferase [Cyanobacteria bacterium SIG32]